MDNTSEETSNAMVATHYVNKEVLIKDHQGVIGFYHGTKTDEALHFEPLLQQQQQQQQQQRRWRHGLEAFKDWRILGLSVCATCEGLLLFRMGSEYCLYNSVTDNIVTIPFLPRHCESGVQRLMYYGLATSPCKRDFSILSIRVTKDLASSSGFMYSSSTGSWAPLEIDDLVFQQLSSPKISALRRITSPRCPYPDLNPVGAAFLKMSLHWLFEDGRIFAFDIETQRWRHMETPGVGRVKNHAEIIVSHTEALNKLETIHESTAMVHKLSRYLYPNIWLGSVGDHLYLLLAISEKDLLQLWILENYDDDEWKLMVEIKGYGSSAAPIFFDGRRIAVADFEEWTDETGALRFFDTFTMEWQQTNFVIPETMEKVRFFFPSIHSIGDDYFWNGYSKDFF